MAGLVTGSITKSNPSPTGCSVISVSKAITGAAEHSWIAETRERALPSIAVSRTASGCAVFRMDSNCCRESQEGTSYPAVFRIGIRLWVSAPKWMIVPDIRPKAPKPLDLGDGGAIVSKLVPYCHRRARVISCRPRAAPDGHSTENGVPAAIQEEAAFHRRHFFIEDQLVRPTYRSRQRGLIWI